MPTRKYEQGLRAEAAEETRKRILDALYARLSEQPSEPVSVEQVARLARVAGRRSTSSSDRAPDSSTRSPRSSSARASSRASRRPQPIRTRASTCAAGSGVPRR